MDMKTISLRSYPVVAAQKRILPLKQSREASYALSLPMSDEIIDYVVIQTSDYQPVLSQKASYPIRKDRYAVVKGTLIDIWI